MIKEGVVGGGCSLLAGRRGKREGAGQAVGPWAPRALRVLSSLRSRCSGPEDRLAVCRAGDQASGPGCRWPARFNGRAPAPDTSSAVCYVSETCSAALPVSLISRTSLSDLLSARPAR